jgi:hypothetical protein
LPESKTGKKVKNFNLTFFSLGSAKKNLYFLLGQKLLDFVGGAEPMKCVLTVTGFESLCNVNVSRQRLSGDDSEFGETEESEALPETFRDHLTVIDGEESKKKENNNEHRMQQKEKGKGMQKGQQVKPWRSQANIGGKRVTNDGIIEFEGGETFGPFSKSRGCSTDQQGFKHHTPRRVLENCTIKKNVFLKVK